MTSPASLFAHAARFTRLYVIALSAVACLSILGQFLVQWSLDRQESDSTIINIAGRQRMLSQRLCKAALVLSAAESATDQAAAKTEIQDALDNWRQANDMLRSGDVARHLPGHNSEAIERALAATQPHFTAMVEAAQAVLESEGDPKAAIERLLSHEPAFLASMDAAVGQFELEAKARVTWLKRIERSLLGLTLLVLLIEGAFIFRPAVKRIRASAAALVESGQQLEVAKQQAEAANQAKSEFLGMISHELRNPLQAVLGGVELAAHASDPQSRNEHLQTTAAAARTLLTLLNDLLDMSRIEARKLEIVAASFDPAKLVAHVANLVRPEADARGLHFDRNIPSDLPAQLLGDELRIQQVLLNLLGNAIKFTPQGQILLRVTLQEDAPEHARLRFEVTDTGPGISAEKQSHIFEPFAQVEESSTRQRVGAGLGLAICERLVRLMGGEIGVSSRLGQGSTFWCELPFAKVITGADRSVAPEPQRPSRPLRILLVDDDPVNRPLLAQLVRLLGHEVVTAVNGPEALTELDCHSFDVALLDWQMPEMNGEQLAEAIRSRRRATDQSALPLIALSAAVRPQKQADQAESQFQRWLTKPVGLSELQSALDSVSDHESSPDPPLLAESPGRWSAVLSRLNGRADLLVQVARDFCEGLPRLLEEITTAHTAEDWHQVGRLSHLIAGQASNFDAFGLVKVAAAVEDQAASGWVSGESIARLKDKADELVSELASWTESVASPT